MFAALEGEKGSKIGQTDQLPFFGRFLEPDPIGYAASPNLYAYVGDDPINRVDPLGLQDKGINIPPCIEKQGQCQPPDPNDIIVTGVRPPPDPEWGPLDTAYLMLDLSKLQIVVASGSSAQNQQATVCVGKGRGLKGNSGLVGRQGGIPGQTVQLGTAAVIPQQWGFPSGAALAPYAGQVHGTIGAAGFSGVTDVIGGKSPVPNMNVRDFLEMRFPNQLIVEIPGASDQVQTFLSR